MAIGSFLLSHVFTLLIQSGILLLLHEWIDQEWSLRWNQTIDIGPSAGYYGCLGVAILGWQHPRRGWIALTIWGVLLLRGILTLLIVHDLHIQSDMAHAIAFPVGLTIGTLASFRSKQLRLG
jgi:hypothetical protein